MRVPTRLRRAADGKKRAKRMNEMDRVLRQIVEPAKPEAFYATSGVSAIEMAGTPWMPHHYKPTIGFTPNVPLSVDIVPPGV